MPELVLSIEQVCEALGCSRSRVFQLLNDGTLERAPRFGRGLRIYRASVERALMPRVRKDRKRRAPSAAGFDVSAFADLTR